MVILFAPSALNHSSSPAPMDGAGAAKELVALRLPLSVAPVASTRYTGLCSCASAAGALATKLGSMADDKLPDDILWHQSGVNKEGDPFVQLLRGNKVIAQMDPAQARDHGRAILEAAEAAEQDAFIFDWVLNKVGGGSTQAAGLLQDFRAYRRERTGKQGGPVNAREWIMPDDPDKPAFER